MCGNKLDDRREDVVSHTLGTGNARAGDHGERLRWSLSRSRSSCWGKAEDALPERAVKPSRTGLMRRWIIELKSDPAQGSSL